MPAPQSPLLNYDLLPHFAKIKVQDIEPAVRETLKQVVKGLEQVENATPCTWDAVMVPLDYLGLQLHKVWSPVSHLHSVANTPELRKVYQKLQPDLVQLSLRFGQSQKLFDKYIALKDSPQWGRLSAAQKRILEKKILDAKLSGIALPKEKKEEFNAIHTRLSSLQTQYSNHVLDAIKKFELVLPSQEDLLGLPFNFRQMAAQSYQERYPEGSGDAAQGPWLVSLDGPSFTTFMENSERRALREKLYLAFISKASEEPFDNEPILHEILQLRQKLARLLGYQNYSEVSLSQKMAGQVEKVVGLLEQLRVQSWESGRAELQELRAYAKKQGCDHELMHWDMAYWANKLKKELYSFTDEELKPYFPLPHVLTGLFQLVERIFSIRVEERRDKPEVWHPDVQFFDIFDTRNHEYLASFYLDPFSRPAQKNGGAWMDDCASRMELGEHSQPPVAYLVCNFAPGVAGQPSLLTFRDVETLFHEFGHGLQHMLTKVTEPEASGIHGVEWDAVELPSQFMENWCYDPQTLAKLSAHFQTGEKLPEALREKIIAARTFRAASAMLRQLQFSLVDIHLHSDFDPFGSVSEFDVQKQVAAQTSTLSAHPRDRFLCSFSHIFAGGYAAGYYSYKWAEVMSADAFAGFEEVGLEDEAAIQEVGQRFRSTILELGGSMHPTQVFKKFRGREPEVAALLRHYGLTEKAH